jgi:hypothetical protein
MFKIPGMKEEEKVINKRMFGLEGDLTDRLPVELGGLTSSEDRVAGIPCRSQVSCCEYPSARIQGSFEGCAEKLHVLASIFS